MIKKIVIVTIILMLTGCYNYNELNDLAIAVAIGVDKDENGYEISLEIINSERKEQGKEYSIYTVNGDTIEEAVSNLYYICPKKIYLSHLEAIVYGSNITDIKDTLDFLGRNKDIREDILVFLTDKNAKDILKTVTNIESINALNIKDLATVLSNNLGTTKLLTLNELLDNYLNPNIEIVIPTVSIDNNNIIFKNMAILKKAKIIGYLNNNEIQGYNILTNNVKNMVINTKNIGANINNLKTNIVVKDNLNIDINIKAKGTIIEVNNSYNLQNDNAINIINKEIENSIKENLTNTLKTINNYNSDIIGILDLYYKNKYNYYKKIKHNWYKNNFKNIKYHINVDVNMYDKGKSLEVIE